MTRLMWFRDDLRLHDSQALSRASEAASLGDATTWWRERSLYALARLHLGGALGGHQWPGPAL
ncbi:deoxyribodipyrimidine photo-lyase [Corynebacterium sp. c19Ua_121]|nr:deoxyribodipyrimidine photo-lyase [Corynebacterium marquesiae]MCZ9301870.1 deoxyribodipyrimidine photo-lyase [Corynebacterium marquesiae]